MPDTSHQPADTGARSASGPDGSDGPDGREGDEPATAGGPEGPDGGDTAGGGISSGLVLLLAVTAGAAVANIYYIQPLLDLVADALDTSDGTAALLVTFTQVGYLGGLALLVPLGDLVERRRLISLVLIGEAVALTACAAAPAFPVLAAALVAVGTMSVVAQIVVPLASVLAAPEERGRVVGTVMSGLLVGILAARTLSGLVAEAGGWRWMFALAAVAMVGLSATLRRALPVVPPTDRIPYRAALRSVVTLVTEEPVLRHRMAFGAFGMAGFSVLWTSVAFLLSDPPYDYGEGVIGLFGLAGIAGALAAVLAGRWADRGHGRIAFTAFLVAVLASWPLLVLGSSSLVALVAGIALLDLGIQGAHISNQAVIYRLRPEVRSRITTAYMISLFVGAVGGSVLSAAVYGAGGWDAICAVGGAIAALAVVTWAVLARRSRPGGEPGRPSPEAEAEAGRTAERSPFPAGGRPRA